MEDKKIITEILSSKQALSYVRRIERVEKIILIFLRYDKTIIPKWLNPTTQSVYPVFLSQVDILIGEQSDFIHIAKNGDMFVVDTTPYEVIIVNDDIKIKRTIVELDYQAMAIAALQGLDLSKAPYPISLVTIGINNMWYPVWFIKADKNEFYRIPAIESPTKSFARNSKSFKELDNQDYTISEYFLFQLTVDEDQNCSLYCGFYNIFNNTKKTCLC